MFKFGIVCSGFRRIGVLCVLVCCVVSACTNAAPADTTGEPKPPGLVYFDPCIMFTKDEISLALGGPVTVHPDPLAPLCRYTKAVPTAEKAPKSTQNTSMNSSQLIVSVGSSPDAAGYYNLDRQDVPSDVKVSDLKDVGDKAFLLDLTVGNALVVLKGKTIYSITYLYYPGNVAQVHKALTRLGQNAAQVVQRNVRTLPAPNPDPCQLVSPADASKKLGVASVKWLFTSNRGGASNCDYFAADGSHGRVQIDAITNSNAAKPVFDNMKGAVDKKQKAIKNLGDNAFFDGQKTTWVLKKDTVFNIVVLGSSDAEGKTLDLSREAVKRF